MQLPIYVHGFREDRIELFEGDALADHRGRLPSLATAAGRAVPPERSARRKARQTSTVGERTSAFQIRFASRWSARASKRVLKLSRSSSSRRRWPLKDSTKGVLPRCAGLDVAGAGVVEAAPISEGLADELEAAVAADQLRCLPSQLDDPFEHADGVVGAHPPCCRCCECFAGVLVGTVRILSGAAVSGLV